MMLMRGKQASCMEDNCIISLKMIIALTLGSSNLISRNFPTHIFAYIYQDVYIRLSVVACFIMAETEHNLRDRLYRTVK